MRSHITDEIIDAIIQNERRHVERPGREPGARRSPEPCFQAGSSLELLRRSRPEPAAEPRRGAAGTGREG